MQMLRSLIWVSVLLLIACASTLLLLRLHKYHNITSIIYGSYGLTVPWLNWQHIRMYLLVWSNKCGIGRFSTKQWILSFHHTYT